MRGVLVMAAVLTVWAVLAIRRPELTYHFSPLIASFAWPAATRRQHAAPLEAAARAGLGAFATVTAFSIALAVGNYMEGPTFIDTRPALIEAILFAAIGAAFGTRVATRESAGLFGRLFS